MNAQSPVGGHEDARADSRDRPCARCLPRHEAVEAALGRDKFAELLYRASYKSARHWCDKEARSNGLSGVAILEHYLQRLSRRGWGRFSIIDADAADGTAAIRLDYSAFTLTQAEACAGKTCYRFSGWFAGMMDWISEDTGRPIETLCCETQCGADGFDYCVFAVHPVAK